MKVLFIHQNFPAQFGQLSAFLARQKGNQVVALSMAAHPAPAGVAVRTYQLIRTPGNETHPLLGEEEGKVLRAEACAAAALRLQQEGFVPDLVIAHPGWGEALFIKDVFPRAKLVMYAEYFYAAEGQDVGFDPEAPALSFAQRCRLRLRNTVNLHSMDIADAAIAPTEWQKSTFPRWARDKMTVIHDGIDAARARPDPGARLALAAHGDRPARIFQAGDQVLSYVARNLEPVRGFQVFMRTLPALLRRHPQAHAIVAGGHGHGYGHAAPDGVSWKAHLLAELEGQLDLERVHFVGQLPYDSYLRLLQVSRAHCYWTTPFVLSWSFLEAAVSGLPVVASRTAPVLEFAERLGVDTVDFFDQDGFADALGARLAKPAARAQRRLPEIDLASCLRRQHRWLRAV